MQRSFAVTLHIIDPDWKLRSTVLEFVYFPYQHNEQTAARLLVSIVPEWDLQHWLPAVTTDSGSEMPAAMRPVESHFS